MSLEIRYVSESFPHTVANGTASLFTTWGDLHWAALTVGRPPHFHLFRHGIPSFHEAIFRLSLLRMSVEQDHLGHLRQTAAYAALDPTEKGMVSYFLGMTLCKLFADKLLQTSWLMHLDVFGAAYAAAWTGKSRPDLFGDDLSGRWHAFESKGRSAPPSKEDKDKAVIQAQRLISIGPHKCDLHIGSFAYFRKGVLEFFWRDPDEKPKNPIRLPEPKDEWRHHYQPALSLADEPDSPAFALERTLADVTVKIHPRIMALLRQERWAEARAMAKKLGKRFSKEGYHRDGIKVSAGESWAQPYDERRLRG